MHSGSHVRLAVVALVLALTGVPGSGALRAQEINPALRSTAWSAYWIRMPGTAPKDFGVYLFRRTFTLPAAPARFVVHASADQRYELFVNGARVVEGPARGDLDHWRFETLDIAPSLHAGTNVIAAIVWNYADEAPMAQMSYETGFLLQGDGKAEQVVDTGTTWKAAANPGLTLLPIDRNAISHQYFVGGPGEIIDAAAWPWGWETSAFDDRDWKPAERLTHGLMRGVRDAPSRWFLVPRGIPLMEETPERLQRVARTTGGQVPAGVLQGTTPWVVPAHATVTALLDRGHLTTAYPEVRTSGGRGASIRLTYTEALRGAKGVKGNRDEVEGKSVTGLADRFLPDGGTGRLFRPLWWRAFRYVEVAVTTADEPLTIEDIRAAFSAYPYTKRGAFEASDQTLDRIFDVGWRTARLCAHETYMDTPYWEQLQYIGDTRIQAMVSLYASGDDRIVKNAIELFDESRIPDGITQSRYPSALPQFIPPFSLFWVGMLHDLWWYGNDTAFLKPYLGGARGVLDWFGARLSPSGLLGPLEWWNYADWVDSFPHGEPPMQEDGQSAILSLQYALALREAADLERAIGSPAQADAYRARADRIVAATVTLCWDSDKRLFADTPAKTSWSQHVNLLAVLADAVPPAGQKALMTRVLDDPSLTQATYYFKFYLFRALEKAGLADRYLDQLGPWKAMLDLGLTTWAEKPEPTRSDSHAWSAHPTVDLLRLVAGVEPAVPGFGQVRIRPHLGTLTTLRATVPTPHGDVTVRYAREGDALKATVSLPPGVTGTIALTGMPVELAAGEQTVTLR
jgi:alpha-L-rhamnosidase